MGAFWFMLGLIVGSNGTAWWVLWKAKQARRRAEVES